MLTSTDPKIVALLQAWQNNVRADGSDNFQTIAQDGRKYIFLNHTTSMSNVSGHFAVDRETEQVYSILSWGKPNFKKPRGTVEFLTEFLNNETKHKREYMQTWWYDLHHTSRTCPSCGKDLEFAFGCLSHRTPADFAACGWVVPTPKRQRMVA
jgi:hypothetical protein